MATAMGSHGGSVHKSGDIKPALKRALAQNAKGAPELIEIMSREEVRMPNLLPKTWRLVV
jgi:thiamine pyrophosphate-dependent acetolactate synthase large subunit-like protein